MAIYPYQNIYPKIDKSAFIAPSADIIGDVTIGKDASIWFACVIRGDVESITIGDRTNIQDGTVIHVTNNRYPTKIGNNVTVGHMAMLHACTLHDNAFVGMRAIIMDRVEVHPYSWIAAGSLVTEGKIIKTGEIWAGHPAKLFRMMTDSEMKNIEISASNYVKYHQSYDIANPI